MRTGNVSVRGTLALLLRHSTTVHQTLATMRSAPDLRTEPKDQQKLNFITLDNPLIQYLFYQVLGCISQKMILQSHHSQVTFFKSTNCIWISTRELKGKSVIISLDSHLL